MALAVEAVVGPGNVQGTVIGVDGGPTGTSSIAITPAGHPLPDQRGTAATAAVCGWLARAGDEGALCLISGGASSLLVAPPLPISLEEKVATTRLLLASGCSIDELNTVRKHLSTVKGGGLLRLSRGPLVSLVLSDVVGDDLGTIGSGPTSPDLTTFAMARAVLDRYGLGRQVPASVAEYLIRGAKGEVAETVKPDEPAARRAYNVVVGSNAVALAAARRRAAELGWQVHVEAAPVVGDSSEAAGAFGQRLLSYAGAGAPVCVLAGGETTVRVRGAGRGGRNQEFALSLADGLAGQAAVVLSAGTDGIDGPTPAAGAFVDGATWARCRDAGLNPDRYLIDNDSFSFFEALGDLLTTGPTGTNVMDIKVGLLLPQ